MTLCLYDFVYMNICSHFWFVSISQVPQMLYLFHKFTNEADFTVPFLVKGNVKIFVAESEG